MKIFIFITLLGCIVGSESFAKDTGVQCSKHSDCQVGCKKEGTPPNCYPKSDVQLKASLENEKCKDSIGGLVCGCKEQKCAYVIPEKKP